MSETRQQRRARERAEAKRGPRRAPIQVRVDYTPGPNNDWTATFVIEPTPGEVQDLEPVTTVFDNLQEAVHSVAAYLEGMSEAAVGWPVEVMSQTVHGVRTWPQGRLVKEISCGPECGHVAELLTGAR